jgi:hypothetical protein
MEEPRASRALSTAGRLVTCLPSASAQEGGCVLLEIHHGLHSRTDEPPLGNNSNLESCKELC